MVPKWAFGRQTGFCSTIPDDILLNRPGPNHAQVSIRLFLPCLPNVTLEQLLGSYVRHATQGGTTFYNL